jgi:hypothetical protein
MPLSRHGSDQGHILIGGTGRSGTTLLVQYFTALGFDTGYSLERAKREIDPISSSGLEHSIGRTVLSGRRLPYVAKSPSFGARLGELIDAGELTVQCFVVPMRSLAGAALSRQRVSEEADRAGLDPTSHPGGVLGSSTDEQSQRRRLTARFYELLRVAAVHEISVHLLDFPAFVMRENYLFERLAPLLSAHGVTVEQSAGALASVARPGLIHRF